jgi:hypothetical protein
MRLVAGRLVVCAWPVLFCAGFQNNMNEEETAKKKKITKKEFNPGHEPLIF